MTDLPSTAISLMMRGPVIPVVVIDRAVDAVPLARALLAGGVDTMEITLRTPAAMEAIASVAASVPGMAVGAGSVNRPDQVRDVLSAGASFLVSPGSSPRLLTAMLESGAPILPGAVTASEVLNLVENGITAMKFFPAATSGGVRALRALGGPFLDVTFCPTGGIDPASSADYLALPNVACVGGTWLTPAGLVDAQDWGAITALAAAVRAPVAR